MDNRPDPEAAARRLVGHRDRHEANPLLEGPVLSDLGHGYAIQDAMDRILTSEHGFKPIGYKLAATNPAARALLKVTEPFFGRLYDRLTSPSPAKLAAGTNFYRVYEPEIVVLLGVDLAPGSAPFDAASIEAATAAILPSIEIIGTYFDPWEKAGAPNLASDNAAHGHWILGEPLSDWSGIDVMSGEITLEVDGEVKASGKGSNVDGGAFGATAWLANELAGRGRTLRAGEYVTTGSVTPPYPVGSDQTVTADFGPLGKVHLSVAS